MTITAFTPVLSPNTENMVQLARQLPSFSTHPPRFSPPTRRDQRRPPARRPDYDHWDNLALRFDLEPLPKFHSTVEELNPADKEQANSWGRTLARAAVECLCGTRPLFQMERWLVPELLEALARRIDLARRLGKLTTHRRASFILSSQVYLVRADAAEVSVTINDGLRVRAVALRLERFRDRWRIVALEIG